VTAYPAIWLQPVLSRREAKPQCVIGDRPATQTYD
jgi:hypothetical protein